MYKNKNNGKIIKEVIFEKHRVYFLIDGIHASLETEIFHDNYEAINDAKNS